MAHNWQWRVGQGYWYCAYCQLSQQYSIAFNVPCKGEENTSTMKPFNLEEALAGKKVVTTSGKEVTDLHQFDTPGEYCLYGLVKSGGINNRAYVGSWRKDGSSNTGVSLFMAIKKKSGWINVYYCGSLTPYPMGPVYQTKEDAERGKATYKCYTFLGTCFFEWEE